MIFPIKTERSRLVSMLLYVFFILKATITHDILYFARLITRACRSVMLVGLRSIQHAQGPIRMRGRRFGLPWTAFYAFSWWTKREIEYRVRSKSPPLDILKTQHRAQNNGWLVTCQMAGGRGFGRSNIHLTSECPTVPILNENPDSTSVGTQNVPILKSN